MKTETEIDTALEHAGQILDLLAPMLAITTDAKLLRFVAVLEAVGALQDALYDLRTP